LGGVDVDWSIGKHQTNRGPLYSDRILVGFTTNHTISAFSPLKL